MANARTSSRVYGKIYLPHLPHLSLPTSLPLYHPLPPLSTADMEQPFG